MIIPSFKRIIVASKITLFRFPVPIFLIVFSTLIIISLPEINIESTFQYFEKLALSCLSVMPLTLAVTLLAEQRSLKRKNVLAIQSGMIAIALAVFLLLPDRLRMREYYTLASLVIQGNLFVSVAPFLNRRYSLYHFWEFNRILFARFVVAAFNSLVLFTGLYFTFLMVERLFVVNILNQVFIFKLGVFILGFFFSFYVLSGIPRAPFQTDFIRRYPWGLKMFAQYLLVPFVTIYFIILYSYCLKMIVLWQQPFPFFSGLILFYTLIGVITFVLVLPAKNKTRWVQAFSNGYFLTLFPLGGLLVFLTAKDINAGWAYENSILIIAIAFWITFISLVLIFDKKKNIRIIPISLGLLLFGLTFSPLNIFKLSLKAKLERLEENIQRTKALSNREKSSPYKDYVHALDKVDKLASEILKFYPAKSLESVLPDSVISQLKESSKSLSLSKIMFGGFTSNGGAQNGNSYVHIKIERLDDTYELDITRYNKLRMVNYSNSVDTLRGAIHEKFIFNKGQLSFLLNEDKRYTFDFNHISDSMSKYKEVQKHIFFSPGDLIVKDDEKNCLLNLYLIDFVQINDSTFSVNQVLGELFY